MSKAICSSPSGPVSDVITPVALAPLGMTVPIGPRTRDDVRAGILSPTSLLFTHTLEPETSDSRVPAGIVAVERSGVLTRRVVVARAGSAGFDGVGLAAAGAGAGATRDGARDADGGGARG